MKIKEQLNEVLSNTSNSFLILKNITVWNTDTIWNNLSIIIAAVKDGLNIITELKSVVGDVILDEEAQEELAQILDDAIKLNAVLDLVDGFIFKIIIKTICYVLAPYVSASRNKLSDIIIAE